MKEENLSTIKRYPITAYLESKGITPIRKLAAYAMYRSPLRDERHPSFKVDTEKNLWIDYAEGRGGSIIDLYMRLEGCTLPEAIRCLGQMIFGRTKSDYPRTEPHCHTPERTDGGRKLIGISDDLPPHLQEYLTKERCIDLGRAWPFLRCVRYEVRGREYEVIGFANVSGGYELRGAGLFKGTLAPKDITPIFFRRAAASLPLRRHHGLPRLSFNERKGRQLLPRDELRGERRAVHSLPARATYHGTPRLPR